MKKFIFIFIAFFLISLLLISLKIFFLKQEERTPESKPLDSEVTLYLKSGEVIQGKLVEKTDKALVLEKHGSSLSFKLDEIIKVEESDTRKDISAGYTFPFSTAIITYEYKGFKKGKETLYIDAAKNKMATETHSGDTNRLSIYDGKVFYDTDLDEKETTAMEIKGELTSFLSQEKLFLGHPVKLESFLGKECKVYEHSMAKAYFWHGIPLKLETTNHPFGKEFNYTITAVTIQLDVPLPEEKFKIPEDVEAKPMEEWIKKLKKMTAEDKDWLEKSEQEERKRLLEKTEEDKEIKKLLEEATRKDGTIDLKKARKLMRGKETKELIEKAKKLEGGEKLIEEATSETGEINFFILSTLLYKKENELRDKSNKLIDEGKNLEEQGKYKEAIKKYTQAIKTNPSKDKGYGYSCRSRLYEKIGDYEKSLEDLSTLIKITPSVFKEKYYSDRAELYKRMGKYQEAIDDYTKALDFYKKRGSEGENEHLKWSKEQIKNSTARILINRGEVYRKMGQDKKAIVDFAEAIELNPGKWYLNEAYFLRGLIHRKMNNKIKMIADWEKADSLGSKLVEGSLVEGIRQGQFVWYHKNGTIRAEGIYINGKLEGLYTCYYNNGNLKGRGHYKSGKREGSFLWYDRTRGYQKSEENYVNGKVDGICKHYYDNGNILEKSTYKNGVRHGMHYKYYENGQIQQMGLFENGVENGIMTLYNPDGSFKKKILFKNGKRIKDIYK